MRSTIAALISAAVITPAVAQSSAPLPPQETAKLEASAGKSAAKERAKVAKAKKKQSKQARKAKEKAPKAS